VTNFYDDTGALPGSITNEITLVNLHHVRRTFLRSLNLKFNGSEMKIKFVQYVPKLVLFISFS
jgi:hypothetical protein